MTSLTTQATPVRPVSHLSDCAISCFSVAWSVGHRFVPETFLVVQRLSASEEFGCITAFTPLQRRNRLL